MLCAKIQHMYGVSRPPDSFAIVAALPSRVRPPSCYKLVMAVRQTFIKRTMA